jgi:hypothetical protein
LSTFLTVRFVESFRTFFTRPKTKCETAENQHFTFG